MPTSPLIPTAQVAARLGVSNMTVIRLAESGTLPSRRIGRLYRFDPAEVEAYVEASRVAS